MILKQLIILVTASMVLCSCTQRSAPVDATSEEARIREQSSAWTAAIIAGDVDKIINLYARDAVQLQGGMRIIAGRDSIKAWYETWVHDPALSYTATTAAVEIASSLDLAYERGVYSFNLSTPNGPAKEVGKYVTIWKKIGGEWKAVLDTGTPDS